MATLLRSRHCLWGLRCHLSEQKSFWNATVSFLALRGWLPALYRPLTKALKKKLKLSSKGVVIKKKKGNKVQVQRAYNARVLSRKKNSVLENSGQGGLASNKPSGTRQTLGRLLQGTTFGSWPGSYITSHLFQENVSKGFVYLPGFVPRLRMKSKRRMQSPTWSRSWLCECNNTS